MPHKDPVAYRHWMNARGKRRRRDDKAKVQFWDWKTKLKRAYGISPDEYTKMFFEQHGCCAICGAEPNGECLHVDHCHVTNKIRGLLCDSCNNGLGRFRDSIAILELAQNYLDRSRMD